MAVKMPREINVLDSDQLPEAEGFQYFLHTRRKGSKRPISKATLTRKSPVAHVNKGTGSPAKAVVQKMTVSIKEAIKEANKGATHQEDRRRELNTEMSRSCETKKANPEAEAIRGVDNRADSKTPNKKPTYTT